MRSILMLLLLAGCPGGGTAPSGDVPTTSTPATMFDVGYDARPANPTCVAPTERFVEEASISTTRIWNSVSLTEPITMIQAPGDAQHWYVIEQQGRVIRFDGSVDSPTSEVVLDIRSQVLSGGELGLLGFAFHPDFPNTPEAFLSYTRSGPESVVQRIAVSTDGLSWEANTLEDIITVDQPFDNHNGGHIAFGPDGYLYWTLGDGGAGGDPLGHGQDLNTLLGTMLRIDISTTPYSIPADNPFIGLQGARDEIYAYGLRNVFKFSFDSSNGDLWAGDVGQNEFEEVDLIQAGGNYGWAIKEGNACFSGNCNTPGLIDPVLAYAQDPGFSVVGGVVYRGSAIPELQGTYLFSDFYHGRIVGITYNADGEARRTRLADTFSAVGHFEEGADGEVYVLSYMPAAIFRLEPEGDAPAPDFPQTLSETGCVEAGDANQMVEGVIPYDMSHAFWSDGAEKRRWLAVPDGTSIDVDESGDLLFPVGTILFKEFTFNGVKVETRLFMHHSEGEWAGYTYKWREDGSDADLVRGSETVDADGEPWTIPGRPACMQCHTEVANRSLGLELGQMQGDVVYPGGRLAPQLDTLTSIGLLPDTDSVDGWPAVDDSDASAEDRARTYLHVNCAMCHQPDGPGRGDLDLRRSTPLADMGVCAAPEHGDLGVSGAQVVSAGDPSASVLYLRMTDQGANRMPPIATSIVDTVGSDVVADWITGLSCP